MKRLHHTPVLPVLVGALCIAAVLYAPDVFAFQDYFDPFPDPGAPAAPVAPVEDETQARFKGIIETFAETARQWQSTLYGAAVYLFFSLALLQFTWSNCELALKGGEFGDFVNVNVRFVMLTGLMYIFMIHSYEWMTAFVQGFRSAGELAIKTNAPGAEGLDPASILQNGMIVAGALFNQLSIWNGAHDLALALCAITLIISFAFIAAFMALAIIESYIIIGAAILLLGFGGSSWTSDIAKRTLMYAISVGAKLFVMQLIVGVAMGSVFLWVETFEQTSSTNALSLVGLVIVILILVKTVPDMVQGMLNGTSMGGTGAMVATVAAAGAATIAAGATIASGGLAAPAAGAAAAGTAAAGAGSGAAGAAGGLLAGSRMMGISQQGAQMAKMAGHVVNAGSGLDLNRSMGSMGGFGIGGGGGGGTSPEKPELPTLPPATGGGGIGLSGTGGGEGDGGVIRGAGSTPAPSGEPSSGSAGFAPSKAESTVSHTSAPPAATAGTGSAQSSSAATAPHVPTGTPKGHRAPGSETATTSTPGKWSPVSSPPAHGIGAESPSASSSTPTPAPAAQTASSTSSVAPASAPNAASSPSMPSSETAGASASAPLSDTASASSTSPTTPTNPPASPSESPTIPPQSRALHAKRAAIVGAVVAGPAGAVLAGAAGAVIGPHVCAKAAAALQAAKARFGLSDSKPSPQGDTK